MDSHSKVAGLHTDCATSATRVAGRTGAPVGKPGDNATGATTIEQDFSTGLGASCYRVTHSACRLIPARQFQENNMIKRIPKVPTRE
ncbi:MAG: hypothetical protein FWD31_09150 [Planctomycetaceae bacterium]|nr:hypothetical protein [Planctomycetaceae bacterium]